MTDPASSERPQADELALARDEATAPDEATAAGWGLGPDGSAPTRPAMDAVVRSRFTSVIATIHLVAFI